MCARGVLYFMSSRHSVLLIDTICIISVLAYFMCLILSFSVYRCHYFHDFILLLAGNDVHVFVVYDFSFFLVGDDFHAFSVSDDDIARGFIFSHDHVYMISVFRMTTVSMLSVFLGFTQMSML